VLSSISYPMANLLSTISPTKSSRLRFRSKIIHRLNSPNLRKKMKPMLPLRKPLKQSSKIIWSSLSRDSLKKLSLYRKRMKSSRKIKKLKPKISKRKKRTIHSKLKHQLKPLRRLKWRNKSEKLRKLIKKKLHLSSINYSVISKAT
jgi:hypothetical protein